MDTLPIAVVTAEAQTECTEPSISAAASADPDGAALAAFAWTVDGAPAGDTATNTPILAMGTHTIGLPVEDVCGGSATATATVAVVDTTPPTIDSFAYPGQICLRPPDHDYAIINVEKHFSVVITDVCDPSPFLRVCSATSSQPDDAEGDGSTIDDVVVAPSHVCLRSERQGGDPAGRTYAVTQLEAVDTSCNRGPLAK